MTRASFWRNSRCELLATEIARARHRGRLFLWRPHRAPPTSRCRPHRRFWRAEWACDYIRREGITHVIDATHPFAAEMSSNAVAACVETARR